MAHSEYVLEWASGLKPTTVSHALRVLRFQGIVGMAPAGRSRLYRMLDETTAALLEHLPDTEHPATVETGRRPPRHVPSPC